MWTSVCTRTSTLCLGEPFTKAIGLYLQKGFQKGVPSLFQSIKFLYSTPEKVRSTAFGNFPLDRISHSHSDSNHRLSSVLLLHQSDELWNLRNVNRYVVVCLSAEHHARCSVYQAQTTAKSNQRRAFSGYSTFLLSTTIIWVIPRKLSSTSIKRYVIRRHW